MLLVLVVEFSSLILAIHGCASLAETLLMLAVGKGADVVVTIPSLFIWRINLPHGSVGVAVRALHGLRDSLRLRVVNVLCDFLSAWREWLGCAFAPVRCGARNRNV